MSSTQVFHHKYRPHSAQVGQSLAWLIRLWFLQHFFLALAIDGQSRAQKPTCIFGTALYPVCVTMLSATCKPLLMDLLLFMPFIHLHILKSPIPSYTKQNVTSFIGNPVEYIICLYFCINEIFLIEICFILKYTVSSILSKL